MEMTANSVFSLGFWKNTVLASILPHNSCICCILIFNAKPIFMIFLFFLSPQWDFDSELLDVCVQKLFWVMFFIVR